jgi:hypothetical protein
LQGLDLCPESPRIENDGGGRGDIWVIPIDKMSVSVLYSGLRRMNVSTYHLILTRDLRRASEAITRTIKSMIAKIVWSML